MELIIESKKHGKHTVYYDECDHMLVSQYNWSLHKGDNTLYVRANAWNKSTKKSFHPYMHRLILGVDKNEQVDHKDHNGLNNRRDNLRKCNGSENAYNKPTAINNSTGYKGVHYYKKRNNYQVNIMGGKKRIHGGYFDKIEDAAKKYNELALKYHREFAYLNKIKMTTEEKIIAIQDAIKKANNHESKMDQIAWSVPALSSLKIRHLVNNLGAISTRYFECGVHKGGLFCSTIRNNDNLDVVNANDSFASDETSEDKAYPQFVDNVNKCKSVDTDFALSIGDTFEIDPTQIYGPVDLYLFDADHSYESQRKAMTYFLPAMADEFIVCVDDWQYGDVKRGTIDGLLDAGCDILFQQELLNEEPYTEDQHRNDEWWRGFYLALLKKK